MSILRLTSFLYSSSPSSSFLSRRIILHRSMNETLIDPRKIGRNSLMQLYGKRGILHFHLNCSSLDASASTNPHFMSASVGSPPQSFSFSQWNFANRNLLFLNIMACTVAISASWLFFSAIPTLLAFKRAAESIEKLLDVATEELPDTMASMRLCGMEISDLTMELSDLGQGIKQGVRNSTRAVRVAEERIRRLTAMDPIVLTQGRDSPKLMEMLPLAKRARNLREAIVKGRSFFGVIFGVSQFSRWVRNFYLSRIRSASNASNQE